MCTLVIMLNLSSIKNSDHNQILTPVNKSIIYLLGHHEINYFIKKLMDIDEITMQNLKF